MRLRPTRCQACGKTFRDWQAMGKKNIWQVHLTASDITWLGTHSLSQRRKATVPLLPRSEVVDVHHLVRRDSTAIASTLGGDASHHLLAARIGMLPFASTKFVPSQWCRESQERVLVAAKLQSTFPISRSSALRNYKHQSTRDRGNQRGRRDQQENGNARQP